MTEITATVHTKKELGAALYAAKLDGGEVIYFHETGKTTFRFQPPDLTPRHILVKGVSRHFSEEALATRLERMARAIKRRAEGLPERRALTRAKRRSSIKGENDNANS